MNDGNGTLHKKAGAPHGVSEECHISRRVVTVS